MLTDDRMETLHEMGAQDADDSGGDLYASSIHRDLTAEEMEVYDYAFRNAFARMNGF